MQTTSRKATPRGVVASGTWNRVVSAFGLQSKKETEIASPACSVSSCDERVCTGVGLAGRQGPVQTIDLNVTGFTDVRSIGDKDTRLSDAECQGISIVTGSATPATGSGQISESSSEHSGTRSRGTSYAIGPTASQSSGQVAGDTEQQSVQQLERPILSAKQTEKAKEDVSYMLGEGFTPLPKPKSLASAKSSKSALGVLGRKSSIGTTKFGSTPEMPKLDARANTKDAFKIRVFGCELNIEGGVLKNKPKLAQPLDGTIKVVGPEALSIVILGCQALKRKNVDYYDPDPVVTMNPIYWADRWLLKHPTGSGEPWLRHAAEKILGCDPGCEGQVWEALLRYVWLSPIMSDFAELGINPADHIAPPHREVAENEMKFQLSAAGKEKDEENFQDALTSPMLTGAPMESVEEGSKPERAVRSKVASVGALQAVPLAQPSKPGSVQNQGSVELGESVAREVVSSGGARNTSDNRKGVDGGGGGGGSGPGGHPDQVKPSDKRQKLRSVLKSKGVGHKDYFFTALLLSSYVLAVLLVACLFGVFWYLAGKGLDVFIENWIGLGAWTKGRFWSLIICQIEVKMTLIEFVGHTTAVVSKLSLVCSLMTLGLRVVFGNITWAFVVAVSMWAGGATMIGWTWSYYLVAYAQNTADVILAASSLFDTFAGTDFYSFLKYWLLKDVITTVHTSVCTPWWIPFVLSLVYVYWKKNIILTSLRWRLLRLVPEDWMPSPEEFIQEVLDTDCNVDLVCHIINTRGYYNSTTDENRMRLQRANEWLDEHGYQDKPAEKLLEITRLMQVLGKYASWTWLDIIEARYYDAFREQNAKEASGMMPCGLRLEK